jgi:O-methyltransferase involved in polyketide biosynthesis
VFVAEGLLAYLAGDEQRELVGRIGGLAAPGSRLALDRIVGDPHSGGRVETLSARSGIDMTQLMAAGDGAGLADSLGAQGWEVEETRVTDVAQRYGRDLGDPFAGPDAAGSGEPPWLDTAFLTARRDPRAFEAAEHRPQPGLHAGR